MELDSLRERIQRIHVETEGREETRLLPPDREEGEGRGGAGWEHPAREVLLGCRHWGPSSGCLGTGQLSHPELPAVSPLSQIPSGKSLAPPTWRATCRTPTLATRTLPGAMRTRRRYSESR